MKEGYVSVDELLDWVREHPLKNGKHVPVCIWGHAGMGTTAHMKNYCEKNNLQLVTFQPAYLASSVELLGTMYRDETTGNSHYAQPDWLPKGPGHIKRNEDGTEAKDEDGNISHSGGILFIDEMNRAKANILNAMLEMVGEGKISQNGWELPDNWIIVVSCSPNKHGYTVSKLDTALVNRMLHYSFVWNETAWKKWGEGLGLPISMSLPHAGSAHLPDDIKPVATPRTLTYMGALYDKEMDLNILRTVGNGLIGKEATDMIVKSHLKD